MAKFTYQPTWSEEGIDFTVTNEAARELAEHNMDCIDNAKIAAGENGADYDDQLEWAASYLANGIIACSCHD